MLELQLLYELLIKNCKISYFSCIIFKFVTWVLVVLKSVLVEVWCVVTLVKSSYDHGS